MTRLLSLALFALSFTAGAQTLKQLESAVVSGHAPVEAKLLLAKNWIAAQQYSRALALLDKIPATNASEATRQILRGLSCEGLSRNPEAIAAYKLALSAVPNDPSAQLRLGVLEYRLGDAVYARDLITLSVASDRTNPEACYYLYILSGLPADRADALTMLLACDGPDGSWSQRALRYWHL